MIERTASGRDKGQPFSDQPQVGAENACPRCLQGMEKILPWLLLASSGLYSEDITFQAIVRKKGFNPKATTTAALALRKFLDRVRKEEARSPF